MEQNVINKRCVIVVVENENIIRKLTPETGECLNFSGGFQGSRVFDLPLTV